MKHGMDGRKGGGTQVHKIPPLRGSASAAAPKLRLEPSSEAAEMNRRQSRMRTDRVLRIGVDAHPLRDLYHEALTLSWPRFLLAGSVLYLAVNVLFAFLYMIDPHGITEMASGSFLDAFFFSVQTFATIGYGRLAPVSLYANMIVTLETLVGLVLLALFTGLGFSRFSRPTARVLFSEVMVVTTLNGQRTLMVRLGNARTTQILEATVAMTVLRSERTREGTFMRRFHDLQLNRRRTPVFGMTFTAMHILDETSPLHSCTSASLIAEGAEILVTVSGTDETLSQGVHARHSYMASQIRFNARYSDVFGFTEDDRFAIDFREFHNTIDEGEAFEEMAAP